MATQNKVSTAPMKRASSAEIRKWYETNKDTIERFKKFENANKVLKDVSKQGTKTIPVFDRDTLRSYLKNITSNERNLRNLSRFLYYRCQPYYRLVMYNANMFQLDCRSVIPPYSINKSNNRSKILKSYNDTLTILDKMNLQYEMLKTSIICFREDVFYGCVYFDDVGLFILPLDPDYCKISGMYSSGDFAFSMDMSYFRSRQDILELWGEPFVSMYRAYQSDQQNGRWQPFPDEYACCFKARAEDWETVVPVYSGLFNSLINLADLEDIQAIADEQAIYKMVWLELETITGSSEINDWKIDPDIVIKYFNRMLEEALPDYISASIIPGKLDNISFPTDASSDTTRLSEATKTVFNTSGGAQILNSATISGTTAFTAAIISDTEFAISLLLPQYQSWVNRFLSYQLTNPSKVKFFEISAYTKDNFKKSLLNDAQYGIPVKLAINSLNGFSEKDTLSLNYLEENILNLSEVFMPLKSSHTQSSDNKSNTTGRPTKDIVDRTDDGEASEDKADNGKS